MTSVLQDKRQKKAWHPRSPENEVTCFGGAVEHVGKFHTLFKKDQVSVLGRTAKRQIRRTTSAI